MQAVERGRAPSTRGRGIARKGRVASARGRGKLATDEVEGNLRSLATGRGTSKRGRGASKRGRGKGRKHRTSSFEEVVASNPGEAAQTTTRADPVVPEELSMSVAPTQARTGQQATAENELEHQSISVRTWSHHTGTASPGRMSKGHASYSIPSLITKERYNMRNLSSDAQDTGSTALSKNTKLTDDRLRLRRVILGPESDVKINYFMSIIETKLPPRLLTEVPKLRDTLNKYLTQIDENPTSSYYASIDALCLELDEGKRDVGYPIIHPNYFDHFVRKCRAQNDAMLQRTIMANVFHPYWLDDMLDYNTEGQWSLPEDACLPSTQSDNIKMPKPDLAISFKLTSLTTDEDDADPIPRDLDACLRPDGQFRCFPFLFMEVKKAGAELADAERDNLYSASQALYNIYQWMVLVSKEDEFLQKVRVFSFVLDARVLHVRVHRAAKSKIGSLKFLFDDLLSLPSYTKDEACRLLDSLLQRYAVKELHPLLKDTFKGIVLLEEQKEQAKRRARSVRGPSAKRRRTSKDGGEYTGQSFGMAQLTASS